MSEINQKSFEDLKIIEPITKALKAKGYIIPTPIQSQAIPVVLQGRDVFGCAQTGTGKTAAFALPILQLIHAAPHGKQHGIKALILAPTRELAIQIGQSFTDYGKEFRIKHAVIFGGVSQGNQTTAIQNGIDILIATPVRLLDLMQQGYIRLNNVKYFVLDEVDRMLDMGFIHDIRKVIAKLQHKKQTLFWSATVPPEIRKLADGLLHNPVNVAVAVISAPAELVQQSVYYVEKNDKLALLKNILLEEHINHALVFTRTKHGADKVAKNLNKNGIRAEAIHGNKSQNARQKALEGFKNRTISILVATDIASRGIDVDKLTHVINYELPEVPETYVHRIGRTGRAGEGGKAISFCSEEERGYLRDISRLIKKDIEVIKSGGVLKETQATVTTEKQSQSKVHASQEKVEKHQEKNHKKGNRRQRISPRH